LTEEEEFSDPSGCGVVKVYINARASRRPVVRCKKRMEKMEKMMI
jgi:hypothetical protein